MKKIAVFLDRDGTINEDVGYPSRFEQIKIYPYSFEAIRRLNKAGLLVIVVTNQSGIARGLLTEDDLSEIHKKMNDIFKKHNAHFDGIYYCPHYSPSNMENQGHNCDCRKPQPGMAFQAAKEFNINLGRSFMIGDKVEDILFGKNIGAKSILVLTGFGKSSKFHLEKLGVNPSYVAKNLLEAVNWILKDINKGKEKE